MKIYAISGLGADERVFDFLKLNDELIPLNWIENFENESIESYSKRLSEKIDTSEGFAVLGVSFGGLIATEINKILEPKITILISSIELKDELPLLYKMVGKLKIAKLIPANLLVKPNPVVQYLFGTSNKKLLDEIVSDSDPKFSKWALNALVNWQNTTRNKKVLKISGSKDKLIPKSKDTITIDGGSHFMIVDRAEEVSRIINERLSNL